MASGSENIWGIHAGKTGDADTLFLKGNCIAIGWATVGDLAKITPDREAFKQRVAAGYPEKKPGAMLRYQRCTEKSDMVNSGCWSRWAHLRIRRGVLQNRKRICA